MQGPRRPVLRHRSGGQRASGDNSGDGGSAATRVFGVSSLLTPFFTHEPVVDYRTALTSDTAAYGRFHQAMLTRGVYPPPSQFEAWFLSAAHTTRHVDRTIAAAREAFKSV